MNCLDTNHPTTTFENAKLMASGALAIEGVTYRGIQIDIFLGPWSKGVELLASDLILEISLSEAIPVNFEELEKDRGFQQWFSLLPKNIHDSLNFFQAGFKNYILNALVLCRQSSAARNLFMNRPNLLGAILVVARKERWQDGELIEITAQPPDEILNTCGFPNTRSVLKLINRCDFRGVSGKNLEKMSYVLNLAGSQKLHSIPYVDIRLFNFLYGNPFVVTEGDLSKGLFISYHRSTHEAIFRELESALKLYGRDRKLLDSLFRCKNMREFFSAYCEFENDWIEQLRKTTSAPIVPSTGAISG